MSMSIGGATESAGPLGLDLSDGLGPLLATEEDYEDHDSDFADRHHVDRLRLV